MGMGYSRREKKPIMVWISLEFLLFQGESMLLCQLLISSHLWYQVSFGRCLLRLRLIIYLYLKYRQWPKHFLVSKNKKKRKFHIICMFKIYGLKMLKLYLELKIKRLLTLSVIWWTTFTKAVLDFFHIRKFCKSYLWAWSTTRQNWVLSTIRWRFLHSNWKNECPRDTQRWCVQYHCRGEYRSSSRFRYSSKSSWDY